MLQNRSIFTKIDLIGKINRIKVRDAGLVLLLVTLILLLLKRYIPVEEPRYDTINQLERDEIGRLQKDPYIRIPDNHLPVVRNVSIKFKKGQIIENSGHFLHIDETEHITFTAPKNWADHCNIMLFHSSFEEDDFDFDESQDPSISIIAQTPGHEPCKRVNITEKSFAAGGHFLSHEYFFLDDCWNSNFTGIPEVHLNISVIPNFTGIIWDLVFLIRSCNKFPCPDYPALNCCNKEQCPKKRNESEVLMGIAFDKDSQWLGDHI